MKQKIYPSLLFVMLPLLLIAQDYRMIFPNRIMYYECLGEESYPNHQMTSVIVDSVVTYSNYESYYFKPQLEQVENSDQCYRLDGLSFSGKKVDVYPNGDNLFKNLRGDSILVKCGALLNTEWVSYVGASGDSLLAKVTSVVKDTVLDGIEDSVKTIHFKRVNFPIPTGNGDVVSEFDIRISKNFGAIETVNFKHYPDVYQSEEHHLDLITKPIILKLRGLTNPKLGFQNLTWKAIHNYGIGDVFHNYDYNVTRYRSDRKTTKKSIIKRVLKREDKNGALNYTFKRFIETETSRNDSLSHSFRIDTVNEIIRNNGAFDHEPGYFYLKDSFLQHSMTFLRDGVSIRNDLIGGSVYNNRVCFSIWDCWCTYSIGPDYQEGVGKFFYSFKADEIINSAASEYKIVYYKKGNTEWGTPFDMDTLQTVDALPKLLQYGIMCFPNPCKSTLQFRGVEQTADHHIVVYDISGKLLIKAPLVEQSLNVSGLENGLYLFNITRKGAVIFKGRFFKEE